MTYPTSSSASDVWSLRDVYKAGASQNLFIELISGDQA